MDSKASDDWRQRLRKAVRATGKKQTAIAEEAGLAPETLSRILNTTLSRPSFETIVRIAHGIDENVGWLLGEEGFALSAEETRDVARALAVLTKVLGRTVRPLRDARLLPNVVATNRLVAGGAGTPTYEYRAVGDTMCGAAIRDGDTITVAATRDIRAAVRKIVVARVNGALYLKELHIDDGHVELASRHPAYAPIAIDEDNDRLELIGIVVSRHGSPG